MVEIKVKSYVIAKNVPESILKDCQKDLTFDNPKYVDAKKHGRFISIDMPDKLLFYQQKKNKIKFPRGYIYFFKNKLKRKGIPFNIIDKSLKLPKIEISFLKKLRGYQEDAVRDCLTYPCCVLEAGTGSGKTIMAIFMMTKRKQPTIIIVHTKELLYQWRDRIKEFTGEDVGIIGDSKCVIKPITVAIINSLNNRIDEVKDKFGHVIVDEVHRCPANIWIETLKEFPAKFTLGLSATPYRRDGLGKAIYAFIGPKMHKVDPERLRKEGAVLSPKIFKIPTKFTFYYRGNYTSMISALVKNVARNKLIANYVKKDLQAFNENILIVSDRVVHCKYIQYELQEIGVKSVLLHGSTGKKDRQKIVEQITSGNVKVVIATLRLIGEGFDAPNLTSLFLTTPIKFSGRLIQTIGRILRPKEGKHPRVFDFVDMDVKVLRYASFNRARVYKQNWG